MQRSLVSVATATVVAALAATGVAIGRDAGPSASGPTATAAAGEGAPIRAGVRNPRGRTNELREETQIIADNARGEYGTRQSNKGEGGGAIYGCRATNDANAQTDPRRSTACIRSSNLNRGQAFQFTTAGALAGVIQIGDAFTPNGDAKPFITNATGVATGLNADRVDGQEAADLVASARRTEGLRAESAGTATNATNAANADTLDGRDSSGFLTSSDIPRGKTELQTGEADATLAQFGGYRVVARCEDNSGDPVATLSLVNVNAGPSVVDTQTDDDATFNNGDTVRVLVASGATQAFVVGEVNLYNPDNNVITFGDAATVGINALGSDCIFAFRAVLA